MRLHSVGSFKMYSLFSQKSLTHSTTLSFPSPLLPPVSLQRPAPQGPTAIAIWCPVQLITYLFPVSHPFPVHCYSYSRPLEGFLISRLSCSNDVCTIYLGFINTYLFVNNVWIDKLSFLLYTRHRIVLEKVD